MSDAAECHIVIERVRADEYRLVYGHCMGNKAISRIMVLEQLTTLFWGLYRAIQEQWENDAALRRNEDRVHDHVFQLLERLMSQGYKRADDLGVQRVELFPHPEDNNLCDLVRVTWTLFDGQPVSLDVRNYHCRFPQAIWNDLAVFRVV